MEGARSVQAGESASGMPISKVHTWLSCGIRRPFFLFSPFREVVGGLRILFRERVFTEITTEAAARTLLWRSRFQDKEFHCPRCHAEQFYALATRPEVRTCKGCRRQWRLRAGTIFESSKTSLLLWVKALFYVMQGKRGMSAQELQRHLGLKSYGRVWSMLQKIRAALQHRDAGYQVGAGSLSWMRERLGAGKPAINATSSWPLRPRPGWMPKAKRAVERGLPSCWWARKPRLTPNSWWTRGCERGPWSIPTAARVSEMSQGLMLTIKWSLVIEQRASDGCRRSIRLFRMPKPDQWDAPWGDGQHYGAVRGRVYVSL